ncbi:TRAP transporter fused permease subunit [Flavonifractor plautii]|uniref:TRAP transporter fused permease subunit n=1 Tax=Flavonifractor plautii TaxID=292800 RepID=A0A6I2RMH2_FLAPL|nr:TRAP transporter fused permease subunit [Flavonifractor plautii]MSB04943.1 TRAP transporter fused permease subunit [Flavonifractor plautii]MSB09204.1 TRAP transporter fused permease subunit [Flavonifractor plautii]MSB50183.1 TRAP transporter fused permease subunit [Flavonifractor plautii]
MIITPDIVFGLILIAVIFVAAQRCVGNAMVIVTLVFIAYGFLGPIFPGFLGHQGLSLKRFINLVCVTSDGIWGTPIYASALYIVLFVILGAVLQETGVGDYLTDLATSAFGKYRGGPAKVAVVASGFFGSISGSPVANVIGTGTFTIPLMKKNGFAPEYAGAVEAAASTGGQIMPPIMGATAFIIAEMLGVPYFEIVTAAVIPAILYYVALMVAVDMEAMKKGLRGVPVSDLPKIKDLVKRIYLIAPLVFLVIALGVFQIPIARTGFWTIIITIVIALVDSKVKLTKERWKAMFISAAKGVIPVAVACAMAGIISGVIVGSGIGFKLSSSLIDLANGHMIILLVLTMVVCLIMGMGVPTTAAYLVLAILVAPALTQMGLNPKAAHLFIFYFGIISAVTPPVALAAYAGAGLAKCSPTKTGYIAFKLAISGFVLPYMFVYNNELLMMGTWYNVLLAICSSVIGVYCLSGVVEGVVFKWAIPIWERAILLAAALMLIKPGIVTDLMGIGILVLMYLWHTARTKAGKEIPINKAPVSSTPNV